jgi:uncharacterized membrane protein (UPF0136 family)
LRRSVILVGVVGLIAAAVLVARVLVEFDWNPSATIKFGEAFSEQNDYAEKLLGEIVVAPQAGHDGKFFFSQAMDPFYLEPDVHAIYLDRPTYRAQRMLYPQLASAGGLAPASATAWGLILVNVLALGVGSAVTGLVAAEMGLSVWFGLSFVLNPGLFIDLYIDGAGIVAFAFLMAAVLLLLEDRLGGAAIALTFAALTRETMLIGAIGLALYWYRSRKTIPWVLATPFAAVLAWWVYVHWRLGEALSQDTQALGLPLQGFVEAFQRWISEPERLLDLLMGALLLLVAVGLAIRAFRHPTALGWAVAGFALLGLLLSEPVWHRYFDSSRALAPVLTAYLILVPSSIAARRTDRDTAPLLPLGKGRA